MERAGLTHRNNSDIKGARICGDGDTGMNKAGSGMMRCIWCNLLSIGFPKAQGGYCLRRKNCPNQLFYLLKYW
jgi:hypothetical protein